MLGLVCSTPGTPKTPFGSGPLFKFTDPAVRDSASTIKDRLLYWCRMKTKEYEVWNYSFVCSVCDFLSVYCKYLLIHINVYIILTSFHVFQYFSLKIVWEIFFHIVKFDWQKYFKHFISFILSSLHQYIISNILVYSKTNFPNITIVTSKNEM